MLSLLPLAPSEMLISPVARTILPSKQLVSDLHISECLECPIRHPDRCLWRIAVMFFRHIHKAIERLLVGELDVVLLAADLTQHPWVEVCVAPLDERTKLLCRASLHEGRV